MVWWCSVAGAQTDPSLSADEIAQRIDDSAIRLDFETTIKIHSEPLEVVNHPELGGTGERFQELRSIYVGSMLWQEWTLRSIRSPGTVPTTAQLQFGFDGQTAFRSTSSEVGYSLFDTPHVGDMGGQAFFFNQVMGRFPAPFDLADSVRNGKAISQEVKDNSLRYSFVPPWGENVVLEIEADLAPIFRITRIYHEVRGDDGKKNRIDFRIVEWGKYGDIQLPERAVLDASAFGRSGFEDKWIRTVSTYERVDAAPLSEPPPVERFSVQYEPGVPIYDARLNLSFTVGSRNLSYDGIGYRVSEPIMSHPGDRLDEILKDALSPSGRQRPVSSPDARESPERSWSAFRVGAIAAGGTALVLMAVGIVLRGRRGDQNG